MKWDLSRNVGASFHGDCSFLHHSIVDARPVGVNAAFVSSTGVVLVWQLPFIAEEASINFFILSYSLLENSEGSTTRKRRQSGNAMIRTVPYQQGSPLGVVVSGLDSDSTYEFRLSVNYSNPALLSVEATLTVHTNTTGKVNRLLVFNYQPLSPIVTAYNKMCIMLLQTPSLLQQFPWMSSETLSLFHGLHLVVKIL